LKITLFAHLLAIIRLILSILTKQLSQTKVRTSLKTAYPVSLTWKKSAL